MTTKSENKEEAVEKAINQIPVQTHRVYDIQVRSALSTLYDAGVKAGEPEWHPYPEESPSDDGRYVVQYRYKHNPEIVKVFIGDWVEGAWTNVLDNVEMIAFMEIPPYKGVR